MEELIKSLQEYGRFLSLQDLLPQWEQAFSRQKIRIAELRLNRDQKQWELEHLENPGFFRRILGKTEEKKERLTHQLREITAALTAAQWEQQDLNQKIESAKTELEALSNSEKTYIDLKKETILTTMQENQLLLEEIATFTPTALAAADRLLSSLEEARHWMQEDVRYKGVRSNNRKMECLSEAAGNARRLVQMIGMLPEGCAAVGSYLHSPEGYVDAVTMEYAKLDRLNNAVNQVRETRNQLRMLQ
ncbi:MAG: hypothetical protein IKB09_01170 [Oscillospiraceae bacterium]|nr:hypothetical protein [Oscillospiraceae bacterium]